MNDPVARAWGLEIDSLNRDTAVLTWKGDLVGRTGEDVCITLPRAEWEALNRPTLLWVAMSEDRPGKYLTVSWVDDLTSNE